MFFHSYLFGQKVDGNAFVVFGVMDGEKKTSIPASLQKVQVRDIKHLTSWDQYHFSSPRGEFNKKLNSILLNLVD